MPYFISEVNAAETYLRKRLPRACVEREEYGFGLVVKASGRAPVVVFSPGAPGEGEVRSDKAALRALVKKLR